MASAKKTPKPTLRRKSEPIAAKAFEKLSVSVSSDLAHEMRVAAVVELRVSESALVETAIRRFLALPEAEKRAALEGQGRRRRVGTRP